MCMPGEVGRHTFEIKSKNFVEPLGRSVGAPKFLFQHVNFTCSIIAKDAKFRTLIKGIKYKA